MKNTVLLLNPPGEKKYIRDYYCSKVSKSSYYFHPIDLVMLSGILRHTCHIEVIDAIADNLTPAQCLSQIQHNLNPDVIISLIGAVSLKEDSLFLQKLVSPQRRMCVTGDVVLQDPHQWLEDHPFVDGAILDFTSQDIVSWIQGNETSLNTFVSRKRKSPGLSSFPKRTTNNTIKISPPLHSLFDSPNYRFPFVRSKKFATVLTSYGCPYNCSFCVMGTLGYTYRELASLRDELNVLEKLGKEEIFFIDQTFGVRKDILFGLCRELEQKKFGWVCYSRVDVLDEDSLIAMQKAGCHTIIFGVESGSELILKKYNKGYTRAQIAHTFSLCRDLGIRTVATFILGLPEETEETAQETISFLKNIDCDFASFNVAVPRQNTQLRKDAVDQGLFQSTTEHMDQTGSFITMPGKYLSKKQIMALKRRAICHFYLRPSYIWRRVRAVSSLYELKEHIYEGWKMLRGV